MTDARQDHRNTEPPRTAQPVGAETPAVTSDELLRGEKSLLITHAGETYRLIVTRNDKLLLQK